jgi:hypothetical protein
MALLVGAALVEWPALDAAYDFGLVLFALPLVAVGGGRFAPWLVMGISKREARYFWEAREWVGSGHNSKTPLAHTGLVGQRFLRESRTDRIGSGTGAAVHPVDGRWPGISGPPSRLHFLSPQGSLRVVYDDEGHFTVLPLLTMTGLRSAVADTSATEKQAAGRSGGTVQISRARRRWSSTVGADRAGEP